MDASVRSSVETNIKAASCNRLGPAPHRRTVTGEAHRATMANQSGSIWRPARLRISQGWVADVFVKAPPAAAGRTRIHGASAADQLLNGEFRSKRIATTER